MTNSTRTLIKYWFSIVLGVSIAAIFLHTPFQRYTDVLLGITIALLLISPKWDRLWPKDDNDGEQSEDKNAST